MIDIKELRIGNLIRGVSEKIEEVKALEEGWVVYADPIPVTEEQLLKFGFKKVHEDDTWDELKISFIDGEYAYWIPGLYYLTLNGDSWVFYHSTDEDTYWEIHGDVKYVHQLQNLYFALENEELEYNG